MTGTSRQPPSTTAEVGGAGGAGDERRADELGDRGADVAGAEDAEREALALRAAVQAEFQAMPALKELPAKPTRKASTSSMSP